MAKKLDGADEHTRRNDRGLRAKDVAGLYVRASFFM